MFTNWVYKNSVRKLCTMFETCVVECEFVNVIVSESIKAYSVAVFEE